MKGLMEEKKKLEKQVAESEKNNKQNHVLQQTLTTKEQEIKQSRESLDREENELARMIIHEKFALQCESELYRTKLEGEIYDRAMKLVVPLREAINEKNIHLVNEVRKYEELLKLLGEQKLSLEGENKKLKRHSMLQSENVIEYAKEGIYKNRDVRYNNQILSR